MLSPASNSSLFFFSASMTSCLVRPITLYRLRLPSGPKHCEALLRTPRQRPPALPVVLAVGAERALVIEDDAAPALATFPTPGSVHRWFPAMVPGSPISVPKKAI